MTSEFFTEMLFSCFGVTSILKRTESSDLDSIGVL